MAIARCKRGGKSQIPSSTAQANLKLQTFKSIALCSFGTWPVEICLGFGFWNLGFWLSSFCRFLNDLPPLAQMLFCGEHVAEADPHYCATAQFCLCEIRAPRRVDSLCDAAVDFINAINGAGAPSRRCARERRGRRGSRKPKTDHTHVFDKTLQGKTRDRRRAPDSIRRTRRIRQSICKEHP